MAISTIHPMIAHRMAITVPNGFLAASSLVQVLGITGVNTFGDTSTTVLIETMVGTANTLIAASTLMNTADLETLSTSKEMRCATATVTRTSAAATNTAGTKDILTKLKRAQATFS